MTPEQLLLGLVAAAGMGVLYWGLISRRAPRAAEDGLQPPSFEESPAFEEARRAARPSAREALAGPLSGLARPLLRGQRNNKLQTELSRAGLTLKAHEFVLLQAGAAAVLGILAFLRFGNPLLLIAGAVVGYFLPNIYLGRRKKARRRAFEGALADTIMLMSNGVKAGYSIQQAMNSIAEAGRPPLSEEIGRVTRETALGIDLETALAHINERLDSKDFDMVVTALLIHRAVGGNLAEVLDKIAETIRERVRVQGEVRVLTAQARASGYIVTGLPFAVGGILSV